MGALALWLFITAHVRSAMASSARSAPSFRSCSATRFCCTILKSQIFTEERGWRQCVGEERQEKNTLFLMHLVLMRRNAPGRNRLRRHRYCLTFSLLLILPWGEGKNRFLLPSRADRAADLARRIKKHMRYSGKAPCSLTHSCTSQGGKMNPTKQASSFPSLLGKQSSSHYRIT